MRVFKLFVGFAIALYFLLLAIFIATQRSLLYYPNRSYVPLAEAGVNRALQEIVVTTSDGLDLKGWYAPPTSKSCTIVFFHGNADYLYATAQIADPYIAAGYGILLTEYRGYSGLTGKPTETGLYHDGRAFLLELTGRGVPSKSIILFGHSLGTGVAIQLAQEFQVGGLMLLAPYLSVPKLARINFPFFPSSYLALDRFDNEKKIGKIYAPVLIVNGDADLVIPPSHGAKLFDIANQPKEYHSLHGRGHNDAFDQFSSMAIDWIGRTCNVQSAVPSG